MLDPRVQKKGGFGAFVERENARGAAADAARELPTTSPASEPAPNRPMLVRDDTPRKAPASVTRLVDGTTDRPRPVDPGSRS